MSGRQYAYQYDTNPRKIKPNYNMPKKNSPQYHKAKQKQKNIVKNKKVAKDTKINQAKQIFMAKFFIFLKCVALFGILFCMIFRNSQISESFSQIQGLKNKIATIQKENDQLEINIQNSTNLQSIEQAAKERLGMQKLTNKQTVQISLPKKDYTEPRTEKVILEQESSWISNIIEKIKNLF